MACIIWRGKRRNYAELQWRENGRQYSRNLGKVPRLEAEWARRAKEDELSSSSNSASGGYEILHLEDAALYCQVSVPAFLDLVRHHDVPSDTYMRRLCFRRTDLDHLLRLLSDKARCGEEAERFVYAIEAVGMGRIKIGIAKDPVNRLRELQTGSPDQLRLLHSVPAANGELDERRAQQAVGECHIRGEWYDCPPADAIAALNSIGRVA